MKLSSDLSIKGLKNLKEELIKYRNGLPTKCEQLVVNLANLGIQVAKQNVGNFGHYILFSVKLEPNTDGCKALMVATNTGMITSTWKTKDGLKSVDVSPLLMVEFGSGFKAQNPKNVQGVGQGTFPGQTHAFDKEGWYWVDEDNVLHHSYGITPKMPMYNASLEIIARIEEEARKVFGTNSG